jgi:tetratricopeptide (TPR) repeat protein
MTLAFQPRVSASSLFREIFVSAGLALALLAPLCVEAEPHFFDKPKEMFMLPEYCRYTQDFRDHVAGGNNRVEIERWTNLMGESFIHMHHYCYALQAVNRASFMSRTEQERIHNLSTSVRECDYVIHNTPADFSMLPDIFTTKGQSLLKMGSVGQGVLELQRAIDMKPDHWPAYAAIGDYYKEAGQIEKAREWLEKGLAAAPNTRPLMRRLSGLDVAQGKRANNK